MNKLKVVIFAPEFDVGGQGYRIKKAFELFEPDFEITSLHNMEGYFHYPVDKRANGQNVYEAFAEADVYHMRNGVEGLSRFVKGRPADKSPANLIVHYHGSRFRQEHVRLHQMAVAAGAIELASTLDLVRLEHEVVWLPSPYDLKSLSTFRVMHGGAKVRVSHAPTNRIIKGTEYVLNAMNDVYRMGAPVELDLIERQTWYDTLTRKGQSDIYVDQLELGYGNNAIEAWAMGQPVIAGVADPAAREFMIDHWGALPFYEANRDNLADKIRDLVYDDDLRRHWAVLGAQHVERYHDHSKVAHQLAFIYRNAA